MGQAGAKVIEQGENSTAKQSGNHVVRGIIFAALGGICWGFSGTCAQLLTSGLGVPVAWITCVRLMSAAVIFLVVCGVREPRNVLAALRDKRSLARIAAFALLGVLLTQVSYITAISYTNAGTGTVLERLGLILIMLYVCLRMKRLPKIKEFLGLVLAIAGTVLIATQGNFGSLAIPGEALFWGLISAFALACYTLIPGKALEKWGSFIVTGLSMLIGGVVATVATQPWTIDVNVTPEVAGIMGAMIIVGTFAAYLFYLQGITDAGPVRAGLVGCVEPVSATVISAVWLGTPVTPIDMLGCAMIIGMVFLVTERDKSDVSGVENYSYSAHDASLFEGRASELGYYDSRLAIFDDFERIKGILEDGRQMMAEIGVKQGTKKYPSSRRLKRAIDNGSVYVIVPSHSGDEVCGESGIIGVFAVGLQGDPAYAHSSGAQWATDSPEPPAPTYAALHWVTVAKDARRRGVGAYILGTAERIAKDAGRLSLRADIFEANEPMRRLLETYGYVSCGTIKLRDWTGRTSSRAAFERTWQ